MNRTPMKRLLAEGAIAGLIAGAVLAILEMIVAGSVVTPWRMFASVVGTEDTLRGEFTFGLFILGFGVHFVLSALFGAAFGALTRLIPREGLRDGLSVAAIGMSYGLAIWVLNFAILSPLFYEWMLRTDSTTQILLHILGFGLPLGLSLWLEERTAQRRVLRQQPA